VKRRWLVLVGFVAVIVSSATTLHAECVGFSLKHYLRYADVVFVGTVTEREPAGGSKAIVHLDVSRVWKGAVPGRMVLYQARWGIDSVEFSAETVGMQYLVFAVRLDARQRQDFGLSEREKAFALPICGGGTSELPKDVLGFYRQLGPGRKPQS
jgi:hypothetical protein